jgi:4'-phosphopantetheinyl transferase
VTTVEVWSAALDVDEPTLLAMERTLSAQEREYARGVIDPLTRWRWVADHGWRRRLLGHVLGLAPEEVAFTVNEHGRPDLAGSPISFSPSRSGAGAVYAVSDDAVVGVDVEDHRDDVDAGAFARRFFTAGERAALQATPAAGRAAACFACWTRKEAYAKAVGTGLVFPLTEVEVWAGDDRPVRRGDVEVHAVQVGDGRAAAVAARTDGDDPCLIRVGALEALLSG